MASSLCDDQLPSLPPQSLRPKCTRHATAEKHTYGQILKSSALVGGSSGLNIAIGIVRTKAMAMLLGPAGFGLARRSTARSPILTQNIAGMGINSSGVRQIAEAVGSDDSQADRAYHCRLAANIDCSGRTGSSLAGRVFRAGVNPNLRQRPARYAPISCFRSPCCFRLVSGRSKGVDPGYAPHRRSCQDGSAWRIFRHISSVFPLSIFFAKKAWFHIWWRCRHDA